MQAVKLKENIYWVGAIDWKLRNFHGYATEKGSTYNAYLIIDEKITLIDTVKAPFLDEMLERIASVVDVSKIDYIVSNHAEPDHSGSLVALSKICPQAKIYTSFPNGVKILKALYGDVLTLNPLKSGDSLSLGEKTLNFVTTPMVHWPDNMVSYLAEDKILFSNDAFGQHYASFERIDKDLDIAQVLYQAKKYYANIVLPYGAQVKKALEALATLDITTIAPSHGIVWEKNIPEILQLYKDFTLNSQKEKAVIVYDTMWGSTEKQAKAIADGFLAKNIQVVLMDLTNNHISDVITELVYAKYIAVGSPTLNNNMLPTVASFLCYMKGLAPKELKYLAFGSYGWGGQSIGLVEKELQSMEAEELMPAEKQLFVPTKDNLTQLTSRVISALE